MPDTSFTYDEANQLASATGDTVVPTFCAMCGPGPACGIYAFVKDGRLQRVAGMAESPVNRGSLCPKGQASAQWLYSPDRLTQPLLRTGARGEGQFTAISWDEAIGRIADKLLEQKAKYGPESLAILSPARRSYSDLIQRFLIVHGSPNYGHSGICAMQKGFAFCHTIGSMPQADIKNSDLVIYWGRQPIYAGPAMDPVRELVDTKKRQAQIIAIKPSVEPDAGMADIWMPLRPGTDAALSLAMLQVVTGENLIDQAFVDTWCYGYSELCEHVRQYTPEWGEQICGVPADLIRRVARLYAGTKAAAIDVGNGVEHAPSSSDAVRAIAILMAITGHLDRPGCNLLGGGPMGGGPRLKSANLPERYNQAMIDKLVGPEFPIAFQPFLEGTSSAYYRIFDSVLTGEPYPVRSIIAPGTQPLASTRGTRRVLEALHKVDFFVTADVTRPAEMNLADIVLPTTTPYETDHPFEARNGWVMSRNRVIEPLGDYKSIYEFFIDLGVRMGYEEDFWQGSIENYQNDLLTPLGIKLDQLRQWPVGKIFPPPAAARTYENYAAAFSSKSQRLNRAPFLPQGKVAIYNTDFAAAGYDPLPVWREPPESLTGTPELASRYPLVLSDYHTSKNFTAAWQRNVPSLREIQPDPTLHIHPITAESRGIADGDWVRLESPHGWLKVKVEYFPGIRPDTVMLLHGWWQGCRELGLADQTLLDGGANVNLLYSVDPAKAFDPLVTAMSSQTLVEVSKYA